jgi:thiosulfate/3-mercaptopyruvate sulfurtransferase
VTTDSRPVSKATAGVLITARDLAALIRAGRPVTLLDVRWRLGGPSGRELYAAGHIPGAAFVDLDRDLAAPPGPGGRHPMPAAADFEAAMRRAGVRDGRLAVVYDDADSTAAARAWWLLRYFGHEPVLVLDGGFRAWKAAGEPVETGRAGTGSAGTGSAGTGSAGTGRAGTGRAETGRAETGRAETGSAGTGQLAAGQGAGDFGARPGHFGLLDADAAATLARDGLLLDARSGERYRGEAEHVDPVAGHIPGAVSAPTAGNVNPDGTFRPAADLAERFRSLGATGMSPVAAYCGSGVTAAHEVLALTLAGIPAGLYVGSWSDWITDPARPVATGPIP